MALLTVLWIIAVLSLMSAAFMHMTRTEVNRSRNLIQSAKAEAVADAGIYRAILALLESDAALRPRVDGTKYHWEFAQSEVLVSVQDEAGKIDLNSASDPLLQGLLRSVGAAPEEAIALVDRVRDFSDADSQRRSNGAEDDDYYDANFTGGAKDGRFDSVVELKQVLGMTEELYELIAPVLTVYSGGRSIDPTVAPREALVALPGATLRQVQGVLESRESPFEGTEADTEEGALGEDERQGESYPVLGVAANDDGAAMDGGRATRSRQRSIFTITSRASLTGGGIFERIAVVRLTGDHEQPFVFHEWRRATAGLSNLADSEEGDQDEQSDQ